jgi:hypothetical protein
MTLKSGPKKVLRKGNKIFAFAKRIKGTPLGIGMAFLSNVPLIVSLME